MAVTHKKRFLKGQMIFEFTVAAMLFFGIMFFIIAYLNQNVQSFSSDAYREILQAKAYQISEILVHHPGNWDDSNPATPTPLIPGFEEDWPVLNDQRMEDFNNYCVIADGYDSLRLVFGLDERLYDFDTDGRRQFNITMTDLDAALGGTEPIIINCGRDPTGPARAIITRVAVNQAKSHTLLMRVAVW